MKGKLRKQLAIVLAAVLTVGTLAGGSVLTANAEVTDGATIALTQADVDRLNGSTSVTRTSVHDPSVIKGNDGKYYVFGSHMAVSSTTDLQNWTFVTGEDVNSPLFGDVSGGNASYNEAFVSNEKAASLVTIKGTDGTTYQVDFGSYDVAAWIGDNTVQGNMWAPDIIYNPTMGKYCMYLSLNGATWNSSIILLTSSNITGPYVYQGPVVFSGFSTTDSAKSFKNTDLELVIGEQEELPAKYQKIADRTWGEYWPHAIDPAVMFDAEGKLWLTYGSWSGGIYMLELDENTGLRDYTVTYASDYDTMGKSVTTDEYFGKKIAGGYYVSGEGPYIEKIGNYYYLFMSYGGFAPNEGYVMRVFRSENPDGPYVDGSGTSAIFTKYLHNYNGLNNMGMKLMANYKWDTMAKAEVSQGHNSAFADSDGKAYVVYHTKFNDGTAGHEVRVHQMFVNEDGWLVVAPYEYSGETISQTGYEAEAVVGDYELIIHDYKIDYTNLAYKSSETITLNADGSISGTYTGTWSTTANSPYVTIVLGGETYKGVFTEQVVDGSNITVMSFTATSTAGVSIWGSGQPTDDVAVAQTVADNSVIIPKNTLTSLELPTVGLNGAVISWTSSNTAVLANDGTVTAPDTDTTVTLTKRIAKGDYYFEQAYEVCVLAKPDASKAYVVGNYFTDSVQDLSTRIDGSLSVPNPFYKGTSHGLDLSGGVTIAFDMEKTGDIHTLGTIFGFTANNGNSGRFFFTPGSYLGFNDFADHYFDANLLNYALVTDYMGDAAHVEICVTDAGFTVTVDGEVAYTQDIIATAGVGNMSDYSVVMDWLQNSAETLYFGHGSFWNAAGWDEANVNLSNVVCSVNPTVSTDAVSYTKDEVVLSTNADITYEENPFYGKNIDNFTLKYTITMNENSVKNGWDGIFSFYESTSGGRISIQSAPYLCYNGGGKWMDVNQPGAGGDDVAPSMVAGTAYDVVITVTENGVTMTVDGSEINLAYGSSGCSYSDIISYITQCDKLTWGVGLATSAYWNTEVCTLTDIEFTSAGNGVAEEEEIVNPNPEIIAEEVVLSAYNSITVMDNPFKKAEFDELYVSYTINFTECTAMNGWDGIFSFYNTATTGRVSFQTAPYVCYNDWAGNWVDINSPANGAAAIAQYGLVPGVDYDVDIIITDESMRMFLNGVEITYTVAGSGATYAGLLDCIASCDQFTFGVGAAQTAFWNTELCTLKDVEITTHVPAIDAIEKEELVLDNNAYIEKTENPFYGKPVDELYVEYTINFAEAAAMNGWDGIFSFYNDTNGRISFQTAPYICYNDWAGNWNDINSPALGGDNAAAASEKGVDVTFTIQITPDKVVMTANGEELSILENGSGATYADLLAFISECPHMSYGVGLAETAFWNTEICTISDLVMAPVSIDVTADGNGSVTGACHSDSTTLTATPDAFNVFEGWYVDGILIGTSESMDIKVCKSTDAIAKFVTVFEEVTDTIEGVETPEDAADALEEIVELSKEVWEDAEKFLELKKIEEVLKEVLNTVVDIEDKTDGLELKTITNALISSPEGGKVIAENATVPTNLPEDMAKKVLKNAVAVDLKLYNTEGQQTELKVPVQLRFELPASIDVTKDMVLLHYAGDGTIDKLDFTIEGDEVVAVTDSFSTFVLANTEDKTETSGNNGGNNGGSDNTGSNNGGNVGDDSTNNDSTNNDSTNNGSGSNGNTDTTVDTPAGEPIPGGAVAEKESDKDIETGTATESENTTDEPEAEKESEEVEKTEDKTEDTTGETGDTAGEPIPGGEVAEAEKDEPEAEPEKDPVTEDGNAVEDAVADATEDGNNTLLIVLAIIGVIAVAGALVCKLLLKKRDDL